jgi:RNA recognition motif-containing protein
VGNLPISATAATLAAKFAACGTVVSIKFNSAPAARHTSAVAFVEMGSNAEAQTAIDKFHLTSVDGRVISVNRMRAANTGGATANVPAGGIQ